MPQVDIVNLNNEKVGTMELSPDVFAAPIRKHLLSEVVHWQRACRRAGTQSALTKAEVNGTTKKPSPQKGRGMARQGSLKSPHQIGGGVAFAPKPRDYSYQMPKAKRRAALAVALSARLKENNLKILSEFPIPEAKTKKAAQILKGLSAERSLVVDLENDLLKRSMRNLDRSKYLEEAGVNVYDILRYPVLMMTQKAVLALQERMQ
ncbi:MAG: 50S ribosomal protein L4 [Myxococcaceae bacterium]|nr:50S ribosomal protein L4 [Myxococcaceae bacterium]MBH2006971.1 50S ribosomal protein L4 [Myxococcaceae bacterium]